MHTANFHFLTLSINFVMKGEGKSHRVCGRVAGGALAEVSTSTPNPLKSTVKDITMTLNASAEPDEIDLWAKREIEGNPSSILRRVHAEKLDLVLAKMKLQIPNAPEHERIKWLHDLESAYPMNFMAGAPHVSLPPGKKLSPQRLLSIANRAALEKSKKKKPR